MSPERCTANRLQYGVLVLALVGGAVALPSARAQVGLNDGAQKITDCDLNAGSPSDRQRVGTGIADDAMKPDLAIAACQKAIAAAPRIGRFHYQLGRAYMKAGQYHDMVRSFERAGELRHVFAWVSLGLERSSGANITKDPGLAAAYFKKAAEQGDPEGQALYAEALLRGEGVRGDATEAVDWLNKAIGQGHVESMVSMGAAYSNGWGVAKDEQKAFAWIERAAQAGSVAAQGSLGYRYNQGIGVSKDQVKALEWTRKAADAGSEIAQYNLAWMYERGDGVERNPRETYAWSRKSAKSGFAPAQLYVGRMLQKGVGVEKDQQEGLAWITKAAEQGEVQAIVDAAWAHEGGVGTAKSSKEAFRWFLKGAEANDAYCQLVVGQAFVNGNGVEVDTIKGKAWLEKASKQGNLIAQSRLAEQHSKDAQAEAYNSQKDTLAEAYSDYQTVKVCHDTQQGFILPRIGLLEMEQARQYMRTIEKASQVSQADKDKLWASSVEKADKLANGFAAWKMLGSGDAKDSAPLEMTCGAAFASLRRTSEPKENGVRKRDF